MNAAPPRLEVRLAADPRRVIAKLFVPGEEDSNSRSRVHLVVDRVRAMTEDDVVRELAAVRSGFGDRHHDLDGILHRHASLVSARLYDFREFSRDRFLLLGAYLTHEFSVEGAALCNPSMVPHPDQGGLRDGQTRFVLSVRAIGEGHLSSIEFRSGVVWPGGIALDDPGRKLTQGSVTGTSIDKAEMIDHLRDMGIDSTTANQALSELPASFTEDALRPALAVLHPHLLERQAVQHAAQQALVIASSHYRVDFPARTPLEEQLLWPQAVAERHGMEDLRLVQFSDGDGGTVYHGTYTAYDGDHVAPHRLTTYGFLTYEMAPLTGPAARNKGMALFPRRVGGRHLALSRWDRESLSLALSSDGRHWQRGPVIRPALDPWEFVQVGNCGSPIETHAGWLVLTHGVGPMRTYGIGAILLDLDEPDQVLAETVEPLLTPSADEREGYVPNVVYSCGALLHGDTLTIPYGLSDAAVGFAQVDLASLLDRMRRRAGSS